MLHKASAKSCLAISLRSAAVLVLLCLTFIHSLPKASAQTNIIGTSIVTGELIGYAISQNGDSVRVENVGVISRNIGVGHLFGQYLGDTEKEVLKVRKTGKNSFAFASQDARGEQIVQRIRLSHPVGDLYYLLTGFDVDGNGRHDVAIVDVSRSKTHRYRWFIIENPMSSSIQERETFLLGHEGERVEWTRSKEQGIEFVSLRQSPGSARIRALLRSERTGNVRRFRARWDPLGVLIPLRLKDSARYDPGIALYSPAKKSIYLFGEEEKIKTYEIPDARCQGHQAITNLSTAGAVSAVEICSNGSYVFAERQSEDNGSSDNVRSSGALPEAIIEVRRADLTRVQDGAGEVPVPVAGPGSDGTEVLDPPPTGTTGQKPSIATATPVSSATPLDTPTHTPTSTPTITPTPTATPIPTPLVFTIDTTQISTGSTGSSQFKIPLIPGGQYSFTVYWGDGTQSYINSYDDVDSIHTYASPGEYTVSVYGQLYGWRFDNTGDRLKLSDISQWGNMFRFAPGAVETASKFTLNVGEEKLEALVAHGGYIWAAAATSPSKIIRFNPNDNSHTTTTLESDETSVYGMATDGTYIYAVDCDASSRIIRIDPATGARVAGYETGVDKLFTVTFDGTYIWAVNNAGTSPKMVRFNPIDTSVTVYDLSGTEGAWSIISVGEHIFGVNNVTLFRFNKASQQLTTVTIAGSAEVEGLAYDGSSVWAISETNPAKILKFNPDTLTYETFTAPTGADSAEGLIFDGTYLWSTLKTAEVAALLKIPPANPGAAMIVPLSLTSARINAITYDGNKIWAGDWESPASLYSISSSFWPSDGFFYGCDNLTVSAVDTPDMTGTTSMRNAFRGCTNFNSDIGSWNVSRVTDYYGAFRDAVSFNNGGGLGVTAYYSGSQTETSKIWMSSATYNGVRLKAITPSDEALTYYYHRASLVDSVATSSGKMKISYGADYPNLTKVRISTTGTLPTGLTVDTDYWIIRQPYNSTSDMRPAALLAATLADAQAGVAINYTNTGSGVHTLIAVDNTDWMSGQPRTQYWTRHYDDGTTIRPVTTNYWSVRWLYRELSSSSKRVFYVLGSNQYATEADARNETERSDLPPAITGNSVLVAKLLVQPGGLRPTIVPIIDPDGYYGGSDSIKSWNVSAAQSFYSTFRGATSFNLPLNWNVSNAIFFEEMFQHARSFNQDLSGWQLSSGTAFNSMFEGAESFNNGDSGNNGLKPLSWTITKGETFANMFNYAKKFNQDVSSWDMRNALNLYGMFAYGIFNNGDPANTQSKPLSWYLPKVTRADFVFYEQSQFNQDIGSWFAPRNGDIMQVTDLRTAICTRQGSTIYKVFNNGGSPSINNWRTPLATDISLIFSRCPEFNQPVNDWDVSNVTDFTSVFYGATAFNQPLNNWNISKATSLYNMFYNASAFNQDLSAWDTGNVTTMYATFNGATNFNNGDTGNNGAKPLPWNASKVTSLGFMFYNASKFNQYIGNWDTGANTSLDFTFYGAASFNNGDTSNIKSRPLAWNTSNVVKMISAFRSASAFNQDVSSWDVSKVTDFWYAFSGASKFNSYVGNWNTASATRFQHMFSQATEFNNGDVSDVASKPLAWSNTANVTDMLAMFQGAARFNQSLASFNTSNATTVAYMFANAYTFNQPLNTWDVSKVTAFTDFLTGARSFKQDLSGWTPSAATTFGIFSTSGTEDINFPGTTDNYDNLLLRLASVTNINSKALGAGRSRYSYTGLGDAAAGTGRAHLTAATSASPTPGHAWSITDGGSANCTFSSSSGLLVTCSGDRPSLSRVVFKSNGTLPTGITAGTTYWTVRVSATTWRLATSLANAQANTVISYTNAGSGTHAAMVLGHTVGASNSSGSLLITLGTGGDLSFSGRKVRFVSSGTLPTGIIAGTDYRINRVSATTYRVMTDIVDSINGTNPIAFTDSGTGTHEILYQ